jgi:hypothetical protein
VILDVETLHVAFALPRSRHGYRSVNLHLVPDRTVSSHCPRAEIRSGRSLRLNADHNFTANQYPPPPSETNKPVRTPEEHPNGAFIEGSFRNPGIQNGDDLRTLLQSVLNSFWWRRKDIERMPSKILDPFVVQRNPNDPAVCQFCMVSYTAAQGALSCVKEHIDI